MASSNFIFLPLFFSLFIFTYAANNKVYVVYMGTTQTEEDPNEIVFQNHRILSSVHSGSVEEAQAAHLYSYRHGFKGFAAKLTRDQAFQIAKMEGVVSVFENKKRKLHTAHSWISLVWMRKKPWKYQVFPPRIKSMSSLGSLIQESGRNHPCLWCQLDGKEYASQDRTLD